MTSTWPAPTITVDESPQFWAATERGELLVPRCDACGRFSWPPRPFCPLCGSQDTVSLIPATGTGTVYSFTIVRKARGAFRELTPYVVAYVELDEGPRILSNIIGVDPESVRIGARVQVTFDLHPDGPPSTDPPSASAARLYRFRPC